jgi:hypothetical protein
MAIWRFITNKNNLIWYFAVLAVLALLLDKERILNVDSTYFFFRIINDAHFWFPEFRAGVFLTQLPLYSLSFVLGYFVVFWVCYKPLKNTTAAVIVLLLIVTGINASYFHPVTETHQALAYSCLLYAWLFYNHQNKLLNAVVTLLIITWCMLTHPVSLFSVGFVVGLYLLSNQNYKQLQNYLPLLFMVIVFGTKILNTQSGYDANQYNSLKDFTNYLPHFFSLYPVKFIAARLNSVYLIPSILFVICLIYLVLKRNYLQAFFLTISVFGFCAISTLTFKDGDNDAMMEKSFMPAVFMILLVFFSSVVSVTKTNFNAGTLFIHVIMCYGIFIIWKTGKMYSARLDYYTQIINYQIKQNKPKLLVTNANLESNYIFNEWATALDIMILSELKYNKMVTAYIANDSNQFNSHLQNENLFLCVPFYCVLDANMLNKTYFKLPQTTYYKLPENIKL